MKSEEQIVKDQKPVLIEVAKLVPYENNAKKHPPEQVDKIAKVIKRFGWQGNPILIDEGNVIINGHGRRLAAIKLGLKKVPVVVAKGLTEEEKKSLRLADNRSAISDYDTDILQQEIESISLAGDVNDLLGITFDAKELDFLEADLGEIDESVFRSDIGEVVTEMKDRVEQRISENDSQTVSVASALGFKTVSSEYASDIGQFMEMISGGSEDPAGAFGEFCRKYAGE